MEFLLRMITSR
jgi:hypothetical protein